MCVKNESLFIEQVLRSLAPFVEQFSIVDNGSTDGTPDIIRRVVGKLNIRCVLVINPKEDFGEINDIALKNTTCRWVLRWAGDIVARTEGPNSFGVIREYAFSLDQKRYYAVYFPHVQLDGDLFHQDPNNLIHYEDYLFTYSPSLHHIRTGRYREIR
jgi:hypothetical protein